MAPSLATLVLLLATAVHAADKPPRIEVPRASKTPVIDGKVNTTEWTRAARVPLMDGGHALLLHTSNYLYVAMVSRRAGVGSVCTTTTANRVRVLHSSAALGTAFFTKDAAKWTLAQGFTFTNRDTGNTPAAKKERSDFLSKEGWFANTDPKGLVQREFQIRLDDRSELPIVLSYMTFVKPKVYDLDVWPETVVDGCAELDLAGGWTDREYTFSPETWGVAVLQ
jgi:hypothetical protein